MHSQGTITRPPAARLPAGPYTPPGTAPGGRGRLACTGDHRLTTCAQAAGTTRLKLDDVAHLASSAADRSKLWAGLGGLRAAIDGERGRRAALRVLAALALQTAVIELGVKRLTRRARPALHVELRFRARRPRSTSFPSGHAANAVAGALLLSDGWRGSRPPLLALAAAVAWSRVRLGLHHASDVVGGAALGALTAAAVRRAAPLPGGSARGGATRGAR